MSGDYTSNRRDIIDCGDYAYVDHMVESIRRSQGIDQARSPVEYDVLLSIHMQSNNPENFSQFLDDLEAVTFDPKNVEVVVKIDDTDEAMNALLSQEVVTRPFKIVYLSTPLVGGFFELWRSMNDMLDVCNPNAYFLWNMNDEMAILNKNWDIMLEKYVGLFPDHLFRLRTSLFRFRNYIDYWENGFAPETSAITTKYWIETCGNWNPCLGPDSFNQCVSYYFSYTDRFNKHKLLRDVPIHDFVLSGEGAFVGLSDEALWKRMSGASKAWYRLMSHEVQEEASRRAQKIHATITGHALHGNSFSIKDNRTAKCIELVNTNDRKISHTYSYRLSFIRIFLTNMWRASYYFHYAGGGNIERRVRLKRIFIFFLLRYVKPTLGWKIQQRQRFTKSYSFKTRRIRMRRRLKRFVVALWGLTQFSQDRAGEGKLGLNQRQIDLIKYCRANSRSKNEYYYPPSAFVYSHMQNKIDWNDINARLETIRWPVQKKGEFTKRQYVCFWLLMYWHHLSAERFSNLLKDNLAMRKFCGFGRYQQPPTPQQLRKASEILMQNQKLVLLLKSYQPVFMAQVD